MATAARAFVLSARAKFNVRLDVGPPAAGGLHEIRSIVADLAVADEVRFTPSAERFTVRCDQPGIAEHENLAYRVAHALDMPLPPVEVDIVKVLPMRAGLGGGSADAAAVLRGLVSMIDEAGGRLAAEAVADAAVRTGSDILACLTPGLKSVGGTGSVVRPLGIPSPPFGVLLLKPGVGIDTAQAYRLLDRVRSKPPDLAQRAEQLASLEAALARADFPGVCALAHNDFQGVIEAAYAPVLDARKRLMEAGAAASLLCGSGSCVAGLFPTAAEAQAGLARLPRVAGDWAVATTVADGP